MTVGQMTMYLAPTDIYCDGVAVNCTTLRVVTSPKTIVWRANGTTGAQAVKVQTALWHYWNGVWSKVTWINQSVTIPNNYGGVYVPNQVLYHNKQWRDGYVGAWAFSVTATWSDGSYQTYVQSSIGDVMCGLRLTCTQYPNYTAVTRAS
jgi:hypothetical protein